VALSGNEQFESKADGQCLNYFVLRVQGPFSKLVCEAGRKCQVEGTAILDVPKGGPAHEHCRSDRVDGRAEPSEDLAEDVAVHAGAQGVSCVHVSIRSLMIIIAMCAAFLALVVRAPFIAILIGPLIASVLEVRKGGNGLTGGTIGGAITWAGLGLIFLTSEWYTHPASRLTAEGTGWLLIAFGVYTISGAVIGLAEGIAFYFVRYLAILPELIQLRAERSARANIFGSTNASHRPGAIGGDSGSRGR
jgi:hypothetical protein